MGLVLCTLYAIMVATCPEKTSFQLEKEVCKAMQQSDNCPSGWFDRVASGLASKLIGIQSYKCTFTSILGALMVNEVQFESIYHWKVLIWVGLFGNWHYIGCFPWSMTVLERCKSSFCRKNRPLTSSTKLWGENAIQKWSIINRIFMFKLVF